MLWQKRNVFKINESMKIDRRMFLCKFPKIINYKIQNLNRKPIHFFMSNMDLIIKYYVKSILFFFQILITNLPDG
jgi:hypothetical protein